MDEKDLKFIKSWEKVLKSGRIKYSLINGLIFGIFTYLFSSALIYFFDNKVYQTSRVVIQLSIFCIGGVLMFYFIHWKANTNRYHSLKNRN